MTFTARAQAFDQLERLWTDTRFNHRRGHDDVRLLINAWLMMLARGDEITWDALYERASAGQFRPKLGYWVRGAIHEDLPRYAPPEEKWRNCPELVTRGKRAGQPCGRNYVTSARVTNPLTGEWANVGWCRTHEAHAAAAWKIERALRDVPEPAPNTGGLLPTYLPRYDWPDMYAKVDPAWKPPYTGIVADHWPVLTRTQTAPVHHLTLTLTPNTGVTELPDERGPAPEPPDLRLVTP